MNNNAQPKAAKNLPFTNLFNLNEHGYSMQSTMVDANASGNKRERGGTSPANTPEKVHMDKKPKSTSQGDTSNDAILKTIESLENSCVDNHMEEVSKQMQQHSSMLASIAKAVQLNSEEVKVNARQKLNTWKDKSSHSQKKMGT